MPGIVRCAIAPRCPKWTLPVLFGVLFAELTARAEPFRYELDAEHLSVGFLVEHVGFAKVLGLFRQASGSFRFDEETGEISDVSIVVETDSIFTNHERRDDHLRSGDFLDTRRFPTMTFTATTARQTSEATFEVEGELELLGEKRPLMLTAFWNRSGEYPFGDEHYAVGVSARGSFERSAFGMTYAVENGWVGDTVEVIIEFEAIRR